MWSVPRCYQEIRFDVVPRQMDPNRHATVAREHDRATGVEVPFKYLVPCEYPRVLLKYPCLDKLTLANTVGAQVSEYPYDYPSSTV
jgi:hypothetical protein